MAYNKTIWEDGQRYGASSFNNIEDGILELERRINAGEVNSSGNAVAKKQTANMAKAVKKLRIGKDATRTSFAFMGDSVFYAFSTRTNDPNEPRVQEDCVADDGTRLAGFYRSATTIYDTFNYAMQKVYGSDKISIVKKVFTGIDAYRANKHYNATGCDFTLINYGINDAIGGHTNKAINGTVKPGEPGYIDYVGNIPLFLEAYRSIIEKNINGGSAVVVVGPVKQTMIGKEKVTDKDEEKGTDTDSRVVIDTYELALRGLAKEYNCPFISGNELTADFDNTMYIDFTHFTQVGFKTIGQRLASTFIGQSPNEPVSINSNTYLGVNTQLSNINLIGNALLDSSIKSPNIPMMVSTPDLYAEIIERVPGGLCAAVSGFGKVMWSFYAEQDGMVVIPSFFTSTADMQVEMILDFDSKQGKWANHWNSVTSTGVIDRSYVEPSKITISAAAHMQAYEDGKRYGLHMLTNTTQPVLKIVSKGWHTVMLQIKPISPETFTVNTRSIPDPMPGEGSISVYGINILSPIEYKILTK